MKTATLIALVFCLLEVFGQGFILSISHFRFQIDYRTVNLVIVLSHILFPASLFCFSLVLYKKQKS